MFLAAYSLALSLGSSRTVRVGAAEVLATSKVRDAIIQEEVVGYMMIMLAMA